MKRSYIFILLLLCIPIGLIMVSGCNKNKETNNSAALLNTDTYFASENSSEKYEVLIKYPELEADKQAHLSLYLSNVNSNVPVSGAKISISVPENDKIVPELNQTDSGIYEISTRFTENKNYTLNINIDAAQGADLIQVSNIEIGKKLAGQPKETAKQSLFNIYSLLMVVGALLIGIIIGLFLKRRSMVGKKLTSLLLLFAMCLTPVSNPGLNAHGGEDHGTDLNKTGTGGPEISIPKETQFMSQVFTEKLDVGDFVPVVNLFGTVLPTSSGKAVVQTPQTGIIRSLNTRVGQSVIKGTLLAMIEQNIDAGTQVSWLTQKNALEAEVVAARKEYDRLKAIADIAAKRDVDEAERRYNTAVRNLQVFNNSGGGSRFVNLYAPITGKVENFNFSIGSSVSAGQDIFTITNTEKLYVEAQVFAKDIDALQAGKEFFVESGDKRRNNKIHLVTVLQTISGSNQSQRVLFEMKNDSAEFRIGEFVNVRVFSGVKATHVAVPNAAITEVNGKPAVFIKRSAEHFVLSYVEIGEDNGTYSTIIKGAEEGERVVVNGTYQLKMIYLNQ